MWFTYLVLAQLICNVAISSTNPFGCKDKKISDEWRKAVMDSHNAMRRKLASGKQTTAGGKLMPYAKDINKLSWDCDLEEVARSQLCHGIDLQDVYGVMYNVYVVLGELKRWWRQAEEADLSVDPKYLDLENDGFATMAYARSTRFACTYGSCLIGGILMCVYDQKPDVDELLYQKAAAPEDICAACPDSAQCVNYLCESKNPESSTTGTALFSQLSKI
ncbi:SCP-like protein [Ancylostoma ceylanicum]|uniref:SCP-like protein n=1 Tax=Ancylostoma ceylanicum TaxID=53326 RepID=A0A0D6LAG0_9BILA|nr:SCP-like protein [Ancylostoma ceylanicum]